MTNIPSDPYPDRVDLFNKLGRLSGQFNDVGDHVSDLLWEWRRIETSDAAREFARVAPEVVQAIYALEGALFRVEIERHL